MKRIFLRNALKMFFTGIWNSIFMNCQSADLYQRVFHYGEGMTNE